MPDLDGAAGSTPAIRSIARWSRLQSRFGAVARQHAHHAFTDTLACMIAGASDSTTVAARQALGRYSSGKVSVVGATRASPPVAALINGTAAHALDFDDSFRPLMGHASAVLVPALLATGEVLEATGAVLIDAYLIGLQAQAVIGAGVNPSHYAVGWHATSTVGCIGAAAGVAWLMGLDETGIERSMTLATSMASGLKGQFGTAAKPLHAGLAARNAVEAAFLGAAGLSGNPNILEHDHGFRALYSRASHESWQEATKNLDEPHVIERVGLAPKRHPCCASTHNTLDMILDLRSAHGFEAVDVAAVDALVGRVNRDNLPYTHPSDGMQARFSMNYCVAVALLKGRLRISDFTQEAVDREDVQALLPLTTLRSYSKEDEEQQTHLPHRVKISLRNGTVLEASREMEKGTLADPFDPSDRWSKYSDCCEGHLYPAVSRELYDRLSRLEDQPNLRFISEALMAAR